MRTFLVYLFLFGFAPLTLLNLAWILVLPALYPIASYISLIVNILWAIVACVLLLSRDAVKKFVAWRQKPLRDAIDKL